MTPPTVRREYLVDPGCARRIATDVVLYRTSRPWFLGVGAVLVLGALAFLIFGPRWAGILFLGYLVLLIIGPFALRSRMARVLQARGFAPGTTITVDYGPESFVVTKDGAHATYSYRDVRRTAVRADTVIVQMGAANLLVLLPGPLVPPEVRPALTGAAP